MHYNIPLYIYSSIWTCLYAVLILILSIAFWLFHIFINYFENLSMFSLRRVRGWGRLAPTKYIKMVIVGITPGFVYIRLRFSSYYVLCGLICAEKDPKHQFNSIIRNIIDTSNYISKHNHAIFINVCKWSIYRGYILKTASQLSMVLSRNFIELLLR